MAVAFESGATPWAAQKYANDLFAIRKPKREKEGPLAISRVPLGCESWLSYLENQRLCLLPPEDIDATAKYLSSKFHGTPLSLSEYSTTALFQPLGAVTDAEQKVIATFATNHVLQRLNERWPDATFQVVMVSNRLAPCAYCFHSIRLWLQREQLLTGVYYRFKDWKEDSTSPKRELCDGMHC